MKHSAADLALLLRGTARACTVASKAMEQLSTAIDKGDEVAMRRLTPHTARAVQLAAEALELAKEELP